MPLSSPLVRRKLSLEALEDRTTPTFADPVNLSVPYNPNILAVADFNGDGKPDVGTALYGYYARAAVLLGNGDGTFQEGVRFGDDIYNQGVAHGDFNADGKIDLAVTNYDDGNVAILPGRGDGTFAEARLFACGALPCYVAVGDFNEDGKLDLATANSGSSFVTVLFGDGTGDLPARLDVPCDQNPNWLAVADLFGDGHLSIVSTHGNTDTVDVLRGRGDGTFLDPVSLPTGDGPNGMGARDLNGDGKVDFVVCDGYGSQVQVYLNQGGGTFSAPTPYATDAIPHDVAFADFDGDRVLDMAVGAEGGGSVTVFPGLGDGRFGASIYRRAVGERTNSLVAADLNRDGRPDLAVGNFGSSDVAILINEWEFQGYFALSSPGAVTAGKDLLVTVSAYRPDGTLNTGFGGRVTFASSDPRATLPGEYLFTPADQGRHTFTVRFAVAGPQSVRAELAGDPGVWGAREGVAVSAAGPSGLRLTGLPVSLTAGQAATFQVTAVDAFGNVASAYRGAVRFTGIDPRSRFPAAYTFTAADQGRHEFRIAYYTAGQRALVVQDAARPGWARKGAAFLIVPGAARLLVVTQPPAVATGAAYLVAVEVWDAFGNRATNYTGTVRLVVNSQVGAVTPRSYKYTAADRGLHRFRAAFGRPGRNWLLAVEDAAGLLTPSIVLVL